MSPGGTRSSGKPAAQMLAAHEVWPPVNSSKRKGDMQALLREVIRPCKRCGEPFRRHKLQRGEYCFHCRGSIMARKAAARRARHRLREHTGLEPWHGTPSGYSNHVCRCDRCRAAYRAYSEEWRNRPEVAERRRANAKRYAKTPEQQLRKRAYQYGLDIEVLRGYLTDEICFACGRKTGDLSVDHDHDCCSGKRACGDCVRGLLCRECNQVLGLVEDDRARLRDLIAYLDRWELRNASQ